MKLTVWEVSLLNKLFVFLFRGDKLSVKEVYGIKYEVKGSSLKVLYNILGRVLSSIEFPSWMLADIQQVYSRIKEEVEDADRNRKKANRASKKARVQERE